MGQTLQILYQMLIDQVSHCYSGMHFIACTGSLGGLAVDWINNKVYFSYGIPNPNHLAVYDMATGGHSVITPTTPHNKFHDLAVDPVAK